VTWELLHQLPSRRSSSVRIVPLRHMLTRQAVPEGQFRQTHRKHPGTGGRPARPAGCPGSQARAGKLKPHPATTAGTRPGASGQRDSGGCEPPATADARTFGPRRGRASAPPQPSCVASHPQGDASGPTARAPTATVLTAAPSRPRRPHAFMTSPTTAQTPDQDTPTPRLGLGAAQIAASALAAVTSALAASFLGVAGTIIGAAVGSVVATVGSAVYAHSLRTAGSRLRELRPQTRASASPHARVVQGPERRPRRRPDRAPSRSRWGGRNPFARLTAVVVGVFVLAMGAISVAEAVMGHPVSSSSTAGTSLGRVVSTGSSTPVPPPSNHPDATATGEPSSTASPTTSVPGAAATPSTAPTGSATPSSPATSGDPGARTAEPSSQPSTQPPAAPSATPTAPVQPTAPGDQPAPGGGATTAAP